MYRRTMYAGTTQKLEEPYSKNPFQKEGQKSVVEKTTALFFSPRKKNNSYIREKISSGFIFGRRERALATAGALIFFTPYGKDERIYEREPFPGGAHQDD